jgi:hypothetical protein
MYSPYEAMNHVVPEEFKNRIQLEWNEIMAWTAPRVDVTASDYNPIWKVPVVVTGDQQGWVKIDVVPSFEEIRGEGDGIIGAIRGRHGIMACTVGGISAQLLALQSIASQLRRELHKLRMHQTADRVSTQKSFTMVNANIR